MEVFISGMSTAFNARLIIFVFCNYHLCSDCSNLLSVIYFNVSPMPFIQFFPTLFLSLAFLIYLWILQCCYVNIWFVSLILQLPFPSHSFATFHLWAHIFTKLFIIIKHYTALCQVKMVEGSRNAGFLSNDM